MRESGNILEELFGGIMSEGSLYEDIDDISIHSKEFLAESKFQESLIKNAKVLLEASDDDKDAVEDIKDKSDTNLDISAISGGLAVSFSEKDNLEKKVDTNEDTDNTKVSGTPEIVIREDAQTENKAEEVKKKDTNEFDIDFAKKKIRAYYKRMGITYIVNSDDQMLVKRELRDAARKYKKFKEEQELNTSKASLHNDNSFEERVNNALESGKTQQKVDDTEDYSSYTIEQLFEIVKPFLIEQGVEKKLVDLSILTKKFGKDNVKNLINKGYIVPIGTKGITLGS